MAPVNKPSRLLSKEINDKVFSKMVRPNCISLVTTPATLYFFSDKEFIQQIVGVVCFECDLRSKYHYLRIYNLEDYDLFFDERVGSNGLKLNSEDPLFFKIDFDYVTIGLQFQSGLEANTEAKELEKALRAGKILEETQPVIKPVMKNVDNKPVTVERGIGGSQNEQTLGAKSSPITTAQLDYANDPMLGEIMKLMGLEYNEVVKSQKMQASLRELIDNLGGTEKFLMKLRAKPPDHKAMRANARADKQNQEKKDPPMETLKVSQQSTEPQSKTATISPMPKIESVQSLEPMSIQKNHLMTTKLSSETYATNTPLSILQPTGAPQLSSEAKHSPTISAKMQQNQSLESSQTAPMPQKATATKPQQSYSPKLIQSTSMPSKQQGQQINNSPEKSSKSSITGQSLQSPQPHANASSGLLKMPPQTKTVDPSPTISSPSSTLTPAMDDEIPIPELKYALPNVRRKVRAVARDGLPEMQDDGISVPQSNPVKRNVGWVGKNVRPEQQKDDIPIPNLNGAGRNVARPCRNIHKKPEDESTRWTEEKLEEWQHDPVLIEILKLWGLKYEDFCKSEKWQDTLEALIAINGGAENLVKKRLEAIDQRLKSEAEEEKPKPKVNKLKIPVCLNWAQEKADESSEAGSQAETSSNLPKAVEEQQAQLSPQQTAYSMPVNQPTSPSMEAQTIMHRTPPSVSPQFSPMSAKPVQFQITPVKKQQNDSIEHSQALGPQTTPEKNQQLNNSPRMSQTSFVSSKTTVQSQITPVKKQQNDSMEPSQALGPQTTPEKNQQLNNSPRMSQTSFVSSKTTVQSQMVTPIKSLKPTQSSILLPQDILPPHLSPHKLESHSFSSQTSATLQPLMSPMASPKSPSEKPPSSPDKMPHPAIFAKHPMALAVPTTPAPSLLTDKKDVSTSAECTPKNNKDELGRIQPTHIEPIEQCPRIQTPRIQFDDDDDEYQRNAHLRDNWQKRVQNRTPAPTPSTPAGPITPEDVNILLDTKGSGLKGTEQVKKSS